MIPIAPTPFKFTVTGTGQLATRDTLANRDGRISFTLALTTANITNLTLQIKRHPDDDYASELVDADFASGSSKPQVISSTGPNTITAGQVSGACLQLGLIYSFRFLITLSTNGSAILRGVN